MIDAAVAVAFRGLNSEAMIQRQWHGRRDLLLAVSAVLVHVAQPSSLAAVQAQETAEGVSVCSMGYGSTSIHLHSKRLFAVFSFLFFFQIVWLHMRALRESASQWIEPPSPLPSKRSTQLPYQHVDR
jgi:hypothetical protein